MRFGVQLNPAVQELETVRELAKLADREGLELLGIQDHPYAAGLADTFSLMAVVLAETEQIRVFPDVASLPMRGPGVLAKASATLDLLSGGRFELGLGAGGFWKAITAMGGPETPTPAGALAAQEEAIEIIRRLWQEGTTVRVHGEHYRIDGIKGGPAPAHPVGIWLGSVGPKALRQTGRIADGWAAPIPSYLPYEKWRGAQDIIDQAASEAGRDPKQITRLAQLVGQITDAGAEGPLLTASDPIRATPQQWAETIAGLARDTGFDSFVFWPERTDAEQLLRWTREVVPEVRKLLG